jgi:hypothetical protein
LIEVDRSSISSLVRLGFIEPDRARDLAAILAALNGVGLTPSNLLQRLSALQA